MIAIELKGLTKTYDSFQLGPCDLTLPAGTILGLVGENGAGKSTTLRLLLDLARPTAGEISILGQSIPAAYPQLKNEIGVVLDEMGFPPSFNALEIGNIMEAAYSNWSEGTYEHYLSLFDLPRKQKFKEFSRGMKMKLALATALSHNAKLLLLDEATSGLDPMVRQELLDLLAEFCDEEHTVVLSSHIVSDLEKICDYIAFLHKGKLLFIEEKDRLLERYGLYRGAPSELNEEAVVAGRVHQYGAETLVLRDKLSAAIPVERVTLEEIILLIAGGTQP